MLNVSFLMMNLLSKFNSCDVKIREQFLMFEISWLKHFKFWFWVLVKFNWSTMLMTCNFYQKSGNLMCWFIRGIPFKAFALVQVISTPVSTFSTAQTPHKTNHPSTICGYMWYFLPFLHFCLLIQVVSFLHLLASLCFLQDSHFYHLITHWIIRLWLITEHLKLFKR